MGMTLVSRDELENFHTRSVSEIYRDLFLNRKNEKFNIEKYKIVGNVVYAGLRSKTNPEHTFVSVVRFSIKDNEIGYLEVDDSYPPIQNDCPDNILCYADKANQYSLNWVESCKRKSEFKKEMKKIRASVVAGSIVTLDTSTSDKKYIVTRYLNDKNICVTEEGCSKEYKSSLSRVMSVKNQN